jgi:SPP1 gp7 family putative phage head morphogenesis protein
VGLHIAILAQAARGHRPRHPRARPTRRLRPVRQSRKSELAYKDRLLGLVKHCRSLVERELSKLRSHWPERVGDSHIVADSISSELVNFIHRVKGQLGGLDTWAKKMAGLAAEANRDTVDERLAEAIKRAIGVDVSSLLKANGPLLQTMRQATAVNVDLIKSIPDQYLGRVSETITGGWVQGIRWESLVEQVQRDGEVTERRAKLIARDQTSKMNSAFNQERQQQVGIERYEWSTSEDERVRPSHADMDGKECRWDDPPIVDDEPVHAGEAINCRCTAIPIVDMEEMQIAVEAVAQPDIQEAA